MPFSPFETIQRLSLRDPSLNLPAQATPYIGEGGGVGGKGGGRADDPTAFDDFGRNDPYGGGLLYRPPIIDPATSESTFIDPTTGETGYKIRVNVYGDRLDDIPQIDQGDYGVRGGGLDITEELRRRADRDRSSDLGYNIVSKVIDYFPRGGDAKEIKAITPTRATAPTVAAKKPEEKTAEEAKRPTAGGTSILAIPAEEKRVPAGIIQPRSGGAINPSELQMLVDRKADIAGRQVSSGAINPQELLAASQAKNLGLKQNIQEMMNIEAASRGRLASGIGAMAQTGAVETPETRARREHLESLGFYPQVGEFPDQAWQSEMKRARDLSGQTGSEEYYGQLRDQRLQDIEGRKRFPTDLLTGENLLTGKEILSVLPSDPRVGAGPPNIRGVRPRDKWLTSESTDPATGKSITFEHSELSVTLNDPRLTGDPTGKTFTNVPSIYNGQIYQMVDPETDQMVPAIENIISEIRPTIKIHPVTGERYWYDKDSDTIRKLERYNSAEEAEAAAKKRSEDIDEYNQWQVHYKR